MGKDANVMTATEIDLDQETIEELSLPCEWPHRTSKCTHVAKWISYPPCECRGATLSCQGAYHHVFKDSITSALACGTCGSILPLSEWRLRWSKL
jgi:hypothetical protein